MSQVAQTGALSYLAQAGSREGLRERHTLPASHQYTSRGYESLRSPGPSTTVCCPKTSRSHPHRKEIMLRAQIRILGVLALLAGALAAPTAAGAAPVSPLCLAGPAPTQAAKADENARAERLDRMIVAMRQQGLSKEKVDKQLAREGVVPVSKEQGDGLIQPLSDGNSVNVWADVYRDTCAANYYVSGGWKFTSMSALTSDAGCNNCNVGGYDAFGVALSRSVGIGYHSVSTWGASNSFPTSSSRMWAHDTNSYGVAYQGQDKYCRAGYGGCSVNDYNFFNGSLFLSITNIGCGYIQAFPKYGHTWSSASLTGLGVGPYSVSVSWSPNHLGWSKAGQSPNRYYCA